MLTVMILLVSVVDFLLLFILMVIGAVLLDRTRGNGELLSKVALLEGLFNQMTMYDMTNQSGPLDGPMFRSADGKYTANTLEELVQKMAEGGEVDIDPSDPDLLKKFFEQLTDDSDDDDEKKPWKDSQ